MHVSGLQLRIENDLALPDFYMVLFNALESFDNTTDLAEILQYEVIQEVGGYAPIPYTYTPNTALYNSDLGWMAAPDVLAQFSEALTNDGIDHTHIGLWQGRGATANKLIDSVDPTANQITVPAHGLTNAARAFVRSAGSMPTGLTIQRYYVKAVSANVIELHTNDTLTAIADFTDTGSGTLRLQYASGALFEFESNTGTINPGSTKSFVFSYQVS